MIRLPSMRDPVLGELEQHDVAGVEVDAHVLALEAVDEGVHLHRRHQVAVEEDVLDVEVDLQLLGRRAAACRRPRAPAVAHVVRHRLVVRRATGMWTAPGTTSRFSVPEVVRRLRIICPASSRPRSRFGRSLLVSGYGQNRNEHRPLMAMPISSAILRIAVNSFVPGLRRQVVVEVVVQLDAVEPGVLRELQALARASSARG